MNIDIKDRITLDDNNVYVIVSKTNYQNQIYYYLMDANNNENIKFCYENTVNNSLVESTDENINQALLPLFLNATKDHVAEINLEEN